MNGAIFATNVDGIEYIKFTGTVRYSHCGGLEVHIEQLFSERSVTDIVINMEEAEVLDSTALGLLAKIAIEMKKRTDKRPVIFIKQGELNNIIRRVCFDQVFNLVSNSKVKTVNELKELAEQPQNDEAVLQRVIDAHQNLAKLSKENENLYQDITGALGDKI